MPRFLIDVNVPIVNSIWPPGIAVHAINLGPNWSDSQLWTYALDQHLTIVSKDADFSNRLMTAAKSPNIVHLKVGNMRLAEFRAFIEPLWPRIAALSMHCPMVQVYRHRIVTLES